MRGNYRGGQCTEELSIWSDCADTGRVVVLLRVERCRRIAERRTLIHVNGEWVKSKWLCSVCWVRIAEVMTAIFLEELQDELGD